MKKKGLYIIFIIIFVAGLSFLLYPMISDTYNSWLQSNAIAEYSEQVDMLEQAEYTAEIEKAQEYNKRLLERDNPYELTDELSIPI